MRKSSIKKWERWKSIQSQYMPQRTICKMSLWYQDAWHPNPVSKNLSPASSKFCQRYPCRWWFQWVMKYSQMHDGKTMEGRKVCCETISQIEHRPDTSNQSYSHDVRQLGAVLKISGDWKHPYGPANNDTLKNLVSDNAFYTASVHNYSTLRIPRRRTERNAAKTLQVTRIQRSKAATAWHLPPPWSRNGSAVEYRADDRKFNPPSSNWIRDRDQHVRVIPRAKILQKNKRRTSKILPFSEVRWNIHQYSH